MNEKTTVFPEGFCEKASDGLRPTHQPLLSATKAMRPNEGSRLARAYARMKRFFGNTIP